MTPYPVIEYSTDYLIRQARGALKRAATHREKAKASRDPGFRLRMARAAEKEYANLFAIWRRQNPLAPRAEWPL